MTAEAQVRRRRACPHACTDYRCDRIARATRTYDAHSFPQCCLPQPAPPCSVPQLRRSTSRKALRTTRANSTLSLLSVSQCHACLGSTSRLPCGANAGRNEAASKVTTLITAQPARRILPSTRRALSNHIVKLTSFPDALMCRQHVCRWAPLISLAWRCKTKALLPRNTIVCQSCLLLYKHVLKLLLCHSSCATTTHA